MAARPGSAKRRPTKSNLTTKPTAVPPSSSCATDGKRIVSYFGSCGLFCYDLNGKELWKHEMPTAATLAGFGTGVSPDHCRRQGRSSLRDVSNDPKIIALDIATGKPKWEKKREFESRPSARLPSGTPQRASKS